MRRWALFSVTDKRGAVELARALSAEGLGLLSTGGTARALREAGLEVRDVAEHTGFPEIMDGRVKTLHPRIHGGLLAIRSNEGHMTAMASHGLEPIDVVVVNLYPFEETVRSGADFETCIENIDIGGPSMVRAAAKNHGDVLVLVDPADYEESLKRRDDPEFRRRMAAKAFRHTAYYDSMVARYLTSKTGENPYQETLTVGGRRALALRYGENPHQTGALYTDPLSHHGIARSIQVWGKELSYNNLLDADAAWELAADLPPGACVVVKHGNPCGAAVGDDLGASYRLAREADPVSAFGGIAAFHGEVDAIAAEAMTEKGNFLEVVIATSFTQEAQAIFANRAGWGQNVRLLAAPLARPVAEPMVRAIRGGWLVQDSDEDPGTEWRIVTKRQPTPDEMSAMRFLWTVVQHVKSNAIVVGTGRQLLGTGAGQMNRVQSVRLAIEQAGARVGECALASDAFFPFPDSVLTAQAAGIRAIVQPGGSKKDEDVIAAADAAGIAMAFTGVRHFRH